MKYIVITFLIFLNIYGICFSSAKNNIYKKGEIIVKYKSEQPALFNGLSSASSSLAASLDKKYKVTEKKQLFKPQQYNINMRSPASAHGARSNLSSICKIKFSDELDSAEVASAYSKDPNVEYAEPNYIYEICDTIPDDPFFSNQWALSNTGQTGGVAGADINAPSAWDIETGNSDIIIAVIDTGVEYSHQDLADNMWINQDEIPDNGIDDDGNGYVDDYRGWDFRNSDNDPVDDHEHGTHCAGIIGAKGNNGIGVSGVCWDVSIMPLKFLSNEGSGSAEDAAEAIIYAADNGAKVISNSWSGSEGSSLLYDAIMYAISKGVLVVCAAGNDSSSSPVYPAYYEECIAVAATDEDDELAYFSNYGDWIDVSAPGMFIYSTVLDNQYDSKNGTSMACPMVAGLCGIILSQDQSAPNNYVRSIVESETDNIEEYNDSFYKGLIGTGRIDAFNAVASEISIENIEPQYLCQGEERDILIHGKGFRSGMTVDISDIIIQDISYISAEETRVSIKVSSSISLGTRDVILTNTIGTQTTKTSGVQIIPQGTEKFEISGYVKQDNGTAFAYIDIKLEGDDTRIVKTDADGYYKFLDILTCDYTISPLGEQYKFEPETREYLNLYSNYEDQDFRLKIAAGHTKWVFDIGAELPIIAAPAIAEDRTIYIGAYEGGYFYALNPDGTEKWRINPGINTSPCVGIDGTVYVREVDFVYALDPMTGQKKWIYEIESIDNASNREVEISGIIMLLKESSPAIASNGTIYVGSFYGELHAIDPLGRKKWSFVTGDMISASPVIDKDGTIYFGSNDEHFYALNPDGTEKWRFDVEQYMHSAAAISKDGTIYVKAGSYIYAFNPDGTKKWRSSGFDFVLNQNPPVIGSDGTIYTGSVSGYLYALDPDDGSQKWKFKTGDCINSAPCIDSNGIIYIGSEDHKLYAIDQDGSKVWDIDLGAEIDCAPTILEDGSLIVGTMDGKIYAICTLSEGLSEEAHWPVFQYNYRHTGSLQENIIVEKVHPDRVCQGDEDTIHIYGKAFPNRVNIEIASMTINAIKVISSSEIEASVLLPDNIPVGGYDVLVISQDEEVAVGSKLLEVLPEGSPKYKISGYVKQADGAAFKNIELNLTGDDTQETVTDEQGYYEFEGLFSGAYYVVISSNGYSFDISNIFFQVLDNDETNQDFVQTVDRGDKKWELDLGADHAIFSSPAIDNNGTIYVGTNDDKFYAIDPNGNKLWELDQPIYSSPLIGAHERLYITSSHKITSVDCSNGQVIWETVFPGKINSHVNTIPGHEPSSAIGDDGTIYVGSCNNRVYAINVDGSIKWEFITGGSVWATPVIDHDGIIYIGSGDGNFYAINPDGTEKWQLAIGAWIEAPAAMDNHGTIYVAAKNYLYAIEPDGTLKWKKWIQDVFEASPVIDEDNNIYIGSIYGNFYSLNRDGEFNWEIDLDGYINSAPCIDADGLIYIGCGDNKLYVIDNTGETIWTQTLDAEINSSPVITEDGKLIVGTMAGTLYSLYTLSDGLNKDAPWPMFQQNIKHTGQSTQDIIPVLELDQDKLNFDGPEVISTQGQTKYFRIYNSGTGGLAGVITADQDWVSLSTTSFNHNDVIIGVHIDPAKFNESGYYAAHLTINSNGGSQIIDIEVSPTVNCVLTKPNPYNLSVHAIVEFYGTGLVPYNTRIDIFTISGEHVKTLQETQGLNELPWDGKNESGDQIKSGIYIYTSKSPKEKWTGKFTVIRK